VEQADSVDVARAAASIAARMRLDMMDTRPLPMKIQSPLFAVRRCLRPATPAKSFHDPAAM
ncbi:MAG: hypothetical protein R3265_17305, partial [Hyphomonas sp.]|nr:hypothetical protein [Hyphomonas sp.]